MTTLGDIFRRYGSAYRARFGRTLSASQKQAMQAIAQCRTEALGGHVYACPSCQTTRYSDHSCRNRHCPTCQQEATQAWLAEQHALLLPLPYFLVTFTLPSELRALALRGTLCMEAQIIVRPAKRWALNWGWRGDAMALKLKLKAKQDYALVEDATRIEAKLGAAPFETAIRVMVAADGADAVARVESTLNEIARVIGAYHQDTSHQQQALVEVGAGKRRITEKMPPAMIARAPFFAPPPALLLPIHTWRRPDILTSLELARLWHPPTPGLGRLIHWLPCRIIAAPPHAYIAAGRSDRIMVGTAKHADGSVEPVGPTLGDLRPPMHITAGMGAGKSRALANIVQQCIRHGLILLDGKGDDQGGSLATTVRQYIPLSEEHRLIIFDILDTDWPIGLNPLAGIDLAKPGAKDQALGQIMAIFARLDPATWGRAPAMKEFVQMATLLVLEGASRSQTAPTLAHVKQCLLDERYRAQLLPSCTNPDVLTFWTVTFPAQGEQQRTSLHALLRRFSQLLTTETTRYMVSQPATQFDHLRARPHRFIARDTATHQLIGYGALRSIRAQQTRLDLMIHPTWQRQGVGQALLNHLIDQARTLDCVAVHVRVRLDYPHALIFLTHRGFTETHRMYGLRLAVRHADLTPFWPRVQRLAAHGIAITTLVEEQRHNPAYVHHLHELQNAVAPDWPDPERVPFTPVTFDDFARRLEHATHAQPDAFFIAQAGSRYIGYCGLSALGTAVHPDYRNQWVATALKVTAIADAQQRGQATMFTCTANPVMVAINEKLGYQHEMVEVRLGKPIV